MVPDSCLRLSAVLKALDDVIAPALPADMALAQEQLALIRKSIALVQAQIPYEYAFLARDAAEFQQLAHDMVEALPAAHPTRATLLAVLKRGAEVVPTTVTDKAVLEAHVRALRSTLETAAEACSNTGDARLDRRIADLVIEHTERQALRERAWVAETGFDPDPSILPSRQQASMMPAAAQPDTQETFLLQAHVCAPASEQPVPFSVRGLDHVVFRVRDVPRMMAFYLNVLGCTLDRAEEALGLYQLRAGRSQIDLLASDGVLGKLGGAAPGQSAHNVDHICMQLAPFNECVIEAHLTHHGIAITERGIRYGAEGDGMSFYIRDPEGNGIELKGAMT